AGVRINGAILDPAIDCQAGLPGVVQMRQGLLDAGLDDRHALIPGLRTGDGLVLAFEQREGRDQDAADDSGPGHGDNEDVRAAEILGEAKRFHCSFLLRMTMRAAWACSEFLLMPRIVREQLQVTLTTLQLVRPLTA